MIRRLVFVGEAAPLGWLRLADGPTHGAITQGADTQGAVTQGADVATLPAEDPAAAVETIAVVPGEAVTLHWVDLPPLAPAQALAAARLLAADVSAGPVEALHIALGPVEADGGRALALVDAALMQDWLMQLESAGITPDRMVPAPLLLPVPDAGVTVMDDGRLWQTRGPRLGFAAEPGLAKLLIGDIAVNRLDETAWLAGLPAVTAAPLLDLRQGRFSNTKRWQPDWRRLQRLAWGGLALLGVVLATEVAATWRFVVAADRAEARLDDAARQVLPRGTVVTDPRAQVAARAAQLGGSGFGGLAAPLLTAIRDVPGVTLHSIEYAPGTGLVAVISVPAPAEQAAIIAALAAAGLDGQFGAARDSGGIPATELRVRAR
jgi:general secretion pathway protein L